MPTVEFISGGTMLCDRVEPSKSGRALNIRIGTCTCYKSICDCLIEFSIPMRAIEAVNGKKVRGDS